jgi:hypothetical protein
LLNGFAGGCPKSPPLSEGCDGGVCAALSRSLLSSAALVPLSKGSSEEEDDDEYEERSWSGI